MASGRPHLGGEKCRVEETLWQAWQVMQLSLAPLLLGKDCFGLQAATAGMP
jgi:hypothetical protein